MTTGLRCKICLGFEAAKQKMRAAAVGLGQIHDSAGCSVYEKVDPVDSRCRPPDLSCQEIHEKPASWLGRCIYLPVLELDVSR